MTTNHPAHGPVSVNMMTELKHPIHHWLMLLKPGEYMTFPPPAFARLSLDSIECYARCSGRVSRKVQHHLTQSKIIAPVVLNLSVNV